MELSRMLIGDNASDAPPPRSTPQAVGASSSQHPPAPQAAQPGPAHQPPASAGPSTSDAPPPAKRARVDSPDRVIAAAARAAADASVGAGPSSVPNGSAAPGSSASAAADADAAAASPYTDLQRAVHSALQTKDGPCLTTSDKVALALEVLRARQLELDLAQARNNIEALVTKTGSAPRTLRSVIPASTVKGLPVGTPVEITAGKFLLSPTTNDPQALFLTLELQHFGEPSRAAGQAGMMEQARGGESAAKPSDAAEAALASAAGPAHASGDTDDAGGASAIDVARASENP